MRATQPEWYPIGESMPEYKLGCGERLPSTTHDHQCFYEKGHAGKHACYCGVKWDEEGRITVRGAPGRRRR